MEKIYYPRTIDSYLLEWKNERAHKPLLLRGVRQVGKSSAVRQLGKTFKYFMEVNFERDKEIISVFTGNLKPKEIDPSMRRNRLKLRLLWFPLYLYILHR